ncbi:hypothetical protein AX15_007453 [Amanita polypyramis BW_CC]|nr:hypothetical protein AX15_007453 [Amanita polypyramis BW_CC]
MDLAMTIKALLDSKPKEPINKKKICPSMNRTALPPLPTPPTPPGFYKNIPSSSSSIKMDRVTWAPMPQIARIDKVTEDLQYLPSSLEDQIAKDQEKLKNKSRPPPTDDSLIPYEEAFTAESFKKRSIPSSKASTATADMSSYAAAAKIFYKKLPTPKWMAERKRKAQANIRPATKPNHFFFRPQVQSLLNHFKPGLRSMGRKLLIEMQDVIEHQENWDIVMDKMKLVYMEWTASNALLLTTDILLSQDQQGLYRSAVTHYLEQEVSEMRVLNRPTTSLLKICRVLTRNTWDSKVITDDELL